MDNVKARLEDLLKYAYHLGELDKKPTFKIEDYKQFYIFEHQLKGKIGVQHNVLMQDGTSIWLRIERLKRNTPPVLPENLTEWVDIANNPETLPVVKEKIIKTVSELEANAFVDQGIVDKNDVSVALKNVDPILKLKDVIFRLEKNPKIKQGIDQYLNEQWLIWSEEEKPRRETIKIYESLFSIQQTIESQGDEQPIEMVWGIGVVRWICEGHTLDIPLVEKIVEIEVNDQDGSIYIYPRTVEPNLSIGPFFALENSGVDALLRFSQQHFTGLSDDLEFSPFIHESFEPVLRKACTQLSESGVYWPDINPNKENREPNKASELLEITDSWVVFVRPRSLNAFLQDIERFKANLESIKSEECLPSPTIKLVSELSNEKIIIGKNGLLSGGDNPSNVSLSNERLLFPKPFNDAQVEIIKRLDKSDGVVVQGPPGTGKTHTIANIICHYLATGRNVLVTSKGESALSVLQDQIPDELRNLTISLLTNERDGMKQLEKAVEMLAAIVSQNNIRELNQNVESLELRVLQLEKEIIKIDNEFKEHGLKQLKPIDPSLAWKDEATTSLELAQYVMNDKGKHDWLIDELGPDIKFIPKFSDVDIADIRVARKNVGNDLKYVGKVLPNEQDLLDSAHLASIHNDLIESAKITEDTKIEHLPPLAVSKPHSVDKAKSLLDPLRQLLSTVEEISQQKWLENIYNHWINGSSDTLVQHFEGLIKEMALLSSHRQTFVQTLVEVEDPSSVHEDLNAALTNLINGNKAFGIFSFRHKQAKRIIDQIKINDERPKIPEEWKIVKDYIDFQSNAKKFVVKWNHLGNELDLPILESKYGKSYREFQDINSQVDRVNKSIDILNNIILDEAKELFPHGVVFEKLSIDANEINKLIRAINLHTSRILLGSQRIKLEYLIKKLSESDGQISKDIEAFLTHTVGNSNLSADAIISEWQRLLAELRRIKKLSPNFNTIIEVTQKIHDSGAPYWANQLKTIEADSVHVQLTPDDWYDSWQWKRREKYLRDIDGREKLKELADKRARLDTDLKRVFSELIKHKTSIGLHQNMTERVQSALMRFVSAISHIGKGTGKRAPRHRKDAYRAMQDCFSGVPCWIIPTWRVSESLPSEFGSFDLVIIDEASQSDITALPAIMRAKKLLVVGDDKQVSPTAAFVAEEKILQLKHNFLKQQPFSELLLPGVSIYDLACSVFPSQRIMLTEHFRCVEPIIRFSMQFYNEPLLPLRIPKASEKITPPLVDVYVKNGIRNERKNINELEAEAIIDEIKAIIDSKKFEGRSIGVISLVGAQQAKHIQDALLFELGEEVYQQFHIACGDASNFQGKEKDIMFLSMVVGPGQGVAMTKQEYEQRFNVALSRAKDRMYLYRSIDESDLKNESDLKLKVLQHFKNPMPQRNFQVEHLIDLCDSDFERSVFTRLKDQGYNVIPQVKVGVFSIDMVVEGNNDRRLAIELDGDKYHPPEKWMDDWSRQRTLERVGWKFWRCWGSSYTIDPDGCFNDLVNTLNSMQIFPCTAEGVNNIHTEYRVYERIIKIDRST